MLSKYILIILLLAGFALPVHAQDDPQVQEFIGQVSPEQPIAYYDLYGMKAGQTIYLYVESDVIDTSLLLCDLSCEKTYAEADDIQIGVNANSATDYTFEADGDYSVAIYDCCFERALGEFRLLIGFNAPDVLTGTAEPTGAEIAIPYVPDETTASTEHPTIDFEAKIVQEVIASVSPEDEFIYFDLYGMQAGVTIYLYAESDAIDTRIVVCDFSCEEQFADNDDISGNNTNSALEYTFETDGDYSLVVTDCCSSQAEGEFRLLMGINEPDILTGEAEANGGLLAVPFPDTAHTITANSAEGGQTPRVSTGNDVQIFEGAVTRENRTMYYDLYEMSAGDTLQIYVEASDIQLAMGVCDLACKDKFVEVEAEEGVNFITLEYTFETDGDYGIFVTDCCSRETEGDFKLTIGLNAPEVLEGEGVPNGAEIAIPYK